MHKGGSKLDISFFELLSIIIRVRHQLPDTSIIPKNPINTLFCTIRTVLVHNYDTSDSSDSS